MIVFEKCDNKTSTVPCKSDDEINEWLFEKYILTLTNQKKFVQHKFEDERLLKTSETKWHALNANTRIDYVFMITRAGHELNDSYFNLGSLMTEDEKGWDIA